MHPISWFKDGCAIGFVALSYGQDEMIPKAFSLQNWPAVTLWSACVTPVGAVQNPTAIRKSNVWRTFDGIDHRIDQTKSPSSGTVRLPVGASLCVLSNGPGKGKMEDRVARHLCDTVRTSSLKTKINLDL